MISKPYQRYLLGKFRDELSFNEVPIKLYLRRRHPADVRDDIASHADKREKTSDGHSKRHRHRRRGNCVGQYEAGAAVRSRELLSA